MIDDRALVVAEAQIKHLALKIEGIEFPASDRNRLSAACFHQALEHHEAIILLVRRNFYGSAFALVRPMFEIYIRAIWLGHCASEIDLKRFQKGKLKKEFAELITDIESLEGYNVGVLSTVKKKSWGAMNDYTHGGPHQVIRRITEDSIAANYSGEEIQEIVTFAGTVGTLATSEISLLAGREDIATALLEEMKEVLAK